MAPHSTQFALPHPTLSHSVPPIPAQPSPSHLCPSHVQVRHLVQYLGVRYLEGSIQIAMEYMDAGSLGDLVQRIGPLPKVSHPTHLISSRCYDLVLISF